jgi:hypothetical protein
MILSIYELAANCSGRNSSIIKPKQMIVEMDRLFTIKKDFTLPRRDLLVLPSF